MSLEALALKVAQSVKFTDDYQNYPPPADVLAQLPPTYGQSVALSPRFRAQLTEILKNDESLRQTVGYTPPENPEDALEEVLETSWQAALTECAFRYYEGKVIFSLALMRKDGETPVELSIRQSSSPDGAPWYVSYVNTFVRTPVQARKAQATPPSKALESWAWLGRWETFLGDLAALALPERWDFVGDQPYSILKSYITTTFYKLQLQGKICISADRQFAAFNTGLVDSRYDDIYACFEPDSHTLPWRFLGFAGAGNRALKKRVASYFNPLPQAASYVDGLSDLLYDTSRTLVVDYDHILTDHPERLPLAYFEQELAGNAEAMELVANIKRASEQTAIKLYDELGELIENDPRVFRALKCRLDDAIELAQKRVSWNYRTAIPCYYPRNDTMSLLLPLDLTDDDGADAALVVELLDSGNYMGQTVLTPRLAYMDARLICRPDSDWLATSDFAAVPWSRTK